MNTYECIVAPISAVMNEKIYFIRAEDPSKALVFNCEARPMTYVKAIRQLF